MKFDDQEPAVNPGTLIVPVIVFTVGVKAGADRETVPVFVSLLGEFSVMLAGTVIFIEPEINVDTILNVHLPVDASTIKVFGVINIPPAVNRHIAYKVVLDIVPQGQAYLG